MPEIQEPSKLKTLVTRCKSLGVKCVLSFGVNSKKSMVKMAQNKETRDKFADELIKMVKQYNLDGLDNDWEYPSTSDGSAQTNLELARGQLIDRLRNYQGFRQHPVIVVFDAYKVKNNPGSIERFGDLSVVYTKEAETADMYIERVTHELGKKHKVRVATSDGLEQVIILGHGALRLSAENFLTEVKMAEAAIRDYLNHPTHP